MATEYQIEFRRPHIIVGNETTTIEAPLVNGADLVAPSSGTVTVYDGSGTAIVDGQAVTITGSVAQYSISAATTASLDPASDWWVSWSLVVSGSTITARNSAYLVKYRIRPSVSNRTILKREPTFTAYPPGATSWQDQIEEAWDTLVNRMIEEGKNPHQITSPHSLKEAMTCLALAYIAEAQATYIPSRGSKYSEKAAMYRACWDAAWARISFDLDTDDDGDADETGQTPEGVVYLSRAPAWKWGGR